MGKNYISFFTVSLLVLIVFAPMNRSETSFLGDHNLGYKGSENMTVENSRASNSGFQLDTVNDGYNNITFTDEFKDELALNQVDDNWTLYSSDGGYTVKFQETGGNALFTYNGGGVDYEFLEIFRSISVTPGLVIEARGSYDMIDLWGKGYLSLVGYETTNAGLGNDLLSFSIVVADGNYDSTYALYSQYYDPSGQRNIFDQVSPTPFSSEHSSGSITMKVTFISSTQYTVTYNEENYGFFNRTFTNTRPVNYIALHTMYAASYWTPGEYLAFDYYRESQPTTQPSTPGSDITNPLPISSTLTTGEFNQSGDYNWYKYNTTNPILDEFNDELTVNDVNSGWSLYKAEGTSAINYQETGGKGTFTYNGGGTGWEYLALTRPVQVVPGLTIEIQAEYEYLNDMGYQLIYGYEDNSFSNPGLRMYGGDAQATANSQFYMGYWNAGGTYQELYGSPAYSTYTGAKVTYRIQFYSDTEYTLTTEHSEFGTHSYNVSGSIPINYLAFETRYYQPYYNTNEYNNIESYIETVDQNILDTFGDELPVNSVNNGWALAGDASITYQETTGGSQFKYNGGGTSWQTRKLYRPLTVEPGLKIETQGSFDFNLIGRMALYGYEDPSLQSPSFRMITLDNWGGASGTDFRMEVTWYSPTGIQTDEQITPISSFGQSGSTIYRVIFDSATEYTLEYINSYFGTYSVHISGARPVNFISLEATYYQPEWSLNDYVKFDYYKEIRQLTTGEYLINLNGVSGTDFDLYIYDNNMQFLHSSSSTSSQESLVSRLDIGYYILVVSSYGLGSYTLNLTFQSPASSPIIYHQLIPGIITATLNSQGDDYYGNLSTTIDFDYVLTLNTNYPNNFDFTVYFQNGSLIGQGYTVSQTDKSLTFTAEAEFAIIVITATSGSGSFSFGISELSNSGSTAFIGDNYGSIQAIDASFTFSSIIGEHYSFSLNGDIGTDFELFVTDGFSYINNTGDVYPKSLDLVSGSDSIEIYIYSSYGTGDFILTISVVNDSIEIPVAFIGDNFGSIPSEGDSYYFEFQTNIGSKYALSLNGDPNTDFDILLYDANGDIFNFSEAYSYPDELSFIAFEDMVLIEIWSYIGAGDFVLSITLVDNVFSEANIGENSGTIASEGDSSFFTFTATIGSDYLFTLNGPAETDFDIGVYDENYNLIDYSIEESYPDQVQITASSTNLVLEVHSYLGYGDFVLTITEIGVSTTTNSKDNAPSPTLSLPISHFMILIALFAIPIGRKYRKPKN